MQALKSLWLEFLLYNYCINAFSMTWGGYSITQSHDPKQARNVLQKACIHASQSDIHIALLVKIIYLENLMLETMNCAMEMVA